jgi:hypothetical protein
VALFSILDEGLSDGMLEYLGNMLAELMVEGDPTEIDSFMILTEVEMGMTDEQLEDICDAAGTTFSQVFAAAGHLTEDEWAEMEEWADMQEDPF